MTVLVDIDNTLNEFLTPFISKVRALGYEYDDSSDSWELADAIHTSNPKAVVAKVFRDMTFWDNLKPQPYSREALFNLNQRYDVLRATVPWRAVPEYLESKIRWLAKYYPFIKESQINFQSDKWNIPGDVIIDDKPDTILKCRDVGKITVMPLTSYNKHIDADVSFSSWKMIPELFDEIDKLMEELRMM